ncbi:integrase core domain-containing protein [Chitinibacteraceae bacterium HSL-7]
MGASPWGDAAIHPTRQTGGNAFIESFNGRLHEECRNQSVFHNLAQARTVIES